MTQVTPKHTHIWLGSFFGANLGFLNYEVLTIQHIPKKELKDEAALMRTKWFDYRRLHPMQATYLFAECYNRAYGDFMATCVDKGMRAMRGFKGKDFLEHREKLSIWRLRQLCDKLGIRYDFFLRHAMRWYALRTFNVHRGEKISLVGPRPSQIASKDDLITDVMLAWEDAQKTSLQTACDPYYRVTNYIGSEDQRAYEDFIVAQIKTRRHRHYSLHAALYIYDAVRVEEAIRQFGAECVEKAINEVPDEVPDEVSHG